VHAELLLCAVRRAAAIVLALAVLGSGATPVAAQDGKQVWAFYLGFWSGESAWNDAAGVLDDFPSRGRYDSRSRGVARGQIEEARRAGVDAFVVSWRGTHDGVATETIETLLDEAERFGFRIGVVLDHFEGGDAAGSQASLSHILGTFADHPSYLRYRGKPVVLFAFQRPLDWGAIRQRVDPGRRSLWISEGLRGERLYGGAMDGMYAFNFAWTDGAARFYERDRKATVDNGGNLFVPTVHPGWDERKVARRDGRPNPTAPRGRDGGAFLRRMWDGAMSIQPDIVMVVSWNEFIENSHIEPSRTHGTQAIDVLGPLAAAWKGSGGGSGGGGGGGSGSGPADLTSEADARQRIQFNPGAALQRAMFSDGFVPNSGEFDLNVGGAWRGQRAEHLGSGRVRIYFVARGDWGTVRVAERGRAQGDRDRALLAEGERRQEIEFNPGASLQKVIFRDGFVPNSPEFRAHSGGREFAVQRAEHLGSGEVRAYYAPVSDFGRVGHQVRRGGQGGGSDDPDEPEEPDVPADPVYRIEGWDAAAQRWVSGDVRLGADDVCTRLRWHTANIAEVYLEHVGHGTVPGTGEVGDGERLACIEASDRESETWVLHVHLRDGNWVETSLTVHGD